jgi:hypothetical protein
MSNSPWRSTSPVISTGSATEVQDVFVHRLAIAGNEEEIERWAVGLADEEHGRDAAADAADGAGAVGRQLAGVHHAEVTFAVHDFAHERLLAEAFGVRILPSQSSRIEPLNRGRDALPRVRADRQVGPTRFMVSGPPGHSAFTCFLQAVLVRQLRVERVADDRANRHNRAKDDEILRGRLHQRLDDVRGDEKLQAQQQIITEHLAKFPALAFDIRPARR